MKDERLISFDSEIQRRKLFVFYPLSLSEAVLHLIYYCLCYLFFWHQWQGGAVAVGVEDGYLVGVGAEACACVLQRVEHYHVQTFLLHLAQRILLLVVCL